ncbi:MAG: hypothetical protein P9M10_02775 [Candidatus Euphemobacter frigidus]|nr:hypothetical protein [Candidatus Euphemobacter frigidus]
MAQDLKAWVILILIGVPFKPGLIFMTIHLYQIAMVKTAILMQYIFRYLHLYLLPYLGVPKLVKGF